MIVESGKYYLYRHVTTDTNEVFYIGRGKKNADDIKRGYYSRSKDKCRNKFWKSKTNKHKYRIEILLETDDFEFLCEKEVEFISLYGRRDLNRGTLVNLTDGGQDSKFIGTYNRTIESIERMRAKLIGRKMPEGFGLEVSKRMKGNIYRKGIRHSTEVQKLITEKHFVPIYAYNLKGEFVKSFESIVCAARELSVHPCTILQCLKGKQKQTKNYQFRYTFLPIIEEVSYKISVGEKILHINTLTGEENIFNSVRDAALNLKLPIKNIYHNLYGESKIVNKIHKFKRLKNE